MEIELKDVAKKFNKEWIFRNVNLNVKEENRTAVIGPNGSGKSTFLQVIAGSLLQTTGSVQYNHQGHSIDSDQIYKYLSLVAPGLSLPDDFTLLEFLDFHFKFKTLKHGVKVKDLPAAFLLEKASDKYIKNFSTGMKQRLKLGIAIYADTPLLLLDEPATNLDSTGIDWYLEEVAKVVEHKMIFVCSNRKDEYSFCDKFINILDFKD